MLTEAQSLGRWLAPAGGIELSPGGKFEVGPVEARVREVVPEHVLELDWLYPGEQPSIVRFELTARGEGTQLVLDHRQISEPVGMGYMARWAGTLARFDEILGGSA